MSQSRNTKSSENGDPVSLTSIIFPSHSNSGFTSPKSKVQKMLQGVGMGSPSQITPQKFGTPTSRATSSGLHTPTRQRSDLRSDSKLRQVTFSTDKGRESNTSLPTESKLVIWGTDVVLSECKELLRSFVHNFTLDNSDEIGTTTPGPLYLSFLYEISLTRRPFLTVNAMHLKGFNVSLYKQLINYPQEVIPAFDAVVNQIFEDLYPGVILEHQIQVRISNVERTKNMRFLNPEDIDQLVNISGMVTRVSNVIPELQEAFYQCYICNNFITVEIAFGRVAEPGVCSHCNSSHTMVLVHNRSLYSDKQIIKLQESPDEMPPGQTPHYVLLFVHNDLVDKVQPGDRVTATGVYRAAPVKINPRNRTVRAVYRTYVDVIHFQNSDKSHLHTQDSEKHELSKDRINEINELSRDGDIYEKLANALAPSIYGNIDVKKGLLLQLFGASQKEFSDYGRSHFRSEINILLCGDPGTCKSQMLKYIHDLFPRGQYTSGKGSSAVGLTAYIIRDPDTRQLVLQSGALVLSDNGICCIDEFDKMSESTRSVLHEVMEQQTLSIAKAGIICQLNARASILAAANPVKSKWDTRLTTISNIEMPHTLLSRFDLIFLILDHQSEAFDKSLARHLVSIYQDKGSELERLQMIDLGMLRDYIAYAKTNLNPKLTEEAAEHLIQSYLEMRRAGSQHGAIMAYPRQLESLIRLSEAHAKVRLSHTVDVIDVIEAMRLHKEALMQSSTDPKTGMIDVGILAAGFSESERKMKDQLEKTIKDYLLNSRSSRSHNYYQLLDAIRKTFSAPVPADLFDASLRSLQDDHIISISDSKVIRYLLD